MEKKDNKVVYNTKEMKILIVEDDGPSVILLTEITKKIFGEILYAKTGADAVAICQLHPDIDLILMDIQLQELDGYEATQQIRQFNKDVLIIAETAYGQPRDRELALQAGCNAYIAKPFNQTMLLKIINSVLNIQLILLIIIGLI